MKKSKKDQRRIAVDKNALKASINRDSFFEFFKEFWGEIIPEELVLNWHLEYLCDELQIIAERVFERKPKEYDLIINISPGSTKSTIASRLFCPWAWTNDPTIKMICGSYGSNLSYQLGTDARKIVWRDKYRRLFPEIELVEEQKGFQSNSAGGQRVATSTGGGITGMHGHFLIVDDPLNPQQAVSDKLIDTANNWIDRTLLSRKVDKKITPFILIMQRLAQNDPTGHLLQQQKDAEKRRKKIAELEKKRASKEDIQREKEKMFSEEFKRQEENVEIEKKSAKNKIGVVNVFDEKDFDKEQERKWNEKVRKKAMSEQNTNKDVDQEKPSVEDARQEKEDDDIEVSKRFKHICLPAVLTKDVTPEKLREKYSEDGLMDPKRLDQTSLDEARDEMGEGDYAGQFLQNPIPSGGLLFKVSALEIEVAAPPENNMRVVRFWDKAGSTRKGSAYTAGVKMGVQNSGHHTRFWVLDVVRGRWRSEEREAIIKRVAMQDGVSVKIGLEVEPGSGGKESAENTIRNLAGFRVFADRPTGEKVLRAEPYSVQVNNGNVALVKGEWVESYIQEMRYFPKGISADQVDASAGAFNDLAGKSFKLGALGDESL